MDCEFRFLAVFLQAVGDLSIRTLVLVLGDHPVQRFWLRDSMALRQPHGGELVGEAGGLIVHIQHLDDDSGGRLQWRAAIVIYYNLDRNRRYSLDSMAGNSAAH